MRRKAAIVTAIPSWDEYPWSASTHCILSIHGIIHGSIPMSTNFSSSVIAFSSTRNVTVRGRTKEFLVKSRGNTCCLFRETGCFQSGCHDVLCEMNKIVIPKKRCDFLGRVLKASFQSGCIRTKTDLTRRHSGDVNHQI